MKIVCRWRLAIKLLIVVNSLLTLFIYREADAQPSTPVTVTITKVKCVDPCRNEGLEAAGESAPDFFARVAINGVTTTTPRGAEDQEEINPDWKIPAAIPNTQPSFPVSIQIWDHDSTSGDDNGDTSPVRNKNNLDFNVDRVTGQWTGDVNWPNTCVTGGGGGDDDEPRLEICFHVSLTDDTDGDGLLDDWEKNGLDADSDGTTDVNLPAMGANPSHKDIFLELDWMAGQSPTRQGIQAIKAAFAAAPLSAGGRPNPDRQPGINLWVDTGGLTDGTGNLVGDNLGGGNAVGFSNISGLTINFYAVKQNATNFNPRRRLVFHYGLSAAKPNNNRGTSTGRNNATTLNDTTQAWIPITTLAGITRPSEWTGTTVTITGGTGWFDPAASEDGAGPNTCNDGGDNRTDGLIDANDPDCNQSPRTITANTATALTVTPPWSVIPDATSTYTIRLRGGQGERGGNDFVEFNHDPGTIMHELGHNLNLQHGGNDAINCKPNYVSVMNYDNRFGIQQNAGSGQGQDFNRDGLLEIVDYSPPRFPGGRGRGSAPLLTLSEALLDETTIILDSTDTANQFVFTNALGKFWNPLNQRADWSGDGDTNDACLPSAVSCPIFNVNTVGVNGAPPGCANMLTNERLVGYNDWANIRLNFREVPDFNDAPINPVIEREPTLEDRDLLLEELKTSDTLLALLKAGIDFSVPVADLRQWLNNPRFTPYPALAEALLKLLEGKRLRQPVFIDVIRSKYEDAPGASSPRSVAEVDLALLRVAVVKGYNERYSETVTDFQTLLR